MKLVTTDFHMGYLERGSNYSSLTDKNRFLAVDYNLDSYVGIVGVGIISGWTVSTNVSASLTIDILPGRGIINNFYAETEYALRQRSTMAIGEREIEIVYVSTTQQPYLTTFPINQRATYISVIQAYDPTYENPDMGDDIINEYVKVAVPSSLILSDESDTYITATLKYPDSYYIAGVDYPNIDGDAPIARKYPSYTSYSAALATYKSSISNVHSYQWRSYPENHYDIVTYGMSSISPTDPNTVLLAKVSTRNGIITAIDTSSVNNLAGMDSTITAMARQVISNHQHGGGKPFDPPQINLQTDERRLALRTINANQIVFDILENTPTSIELGHTHSYKIDSLGTGYTVEINGNNIISHFHKISNYIVGDAELNSGSIASHTHTIDTNVINTIAPNPTFVIYSNSKIIGNQDSSNITIDTDNKIVTCLNVSQGIFRTYYTSFDFQTASMANAQTYTYTENVLDVNTFMNSMIHDFYSRYNIDSFTVVSNTVADSSLNPFVFENTSDANVNGIVQTGTVFSVNNTEVTNQSSIAQILLQKENDTFIFTPNAARDIPITMLIAPTVSDYNFNIEILNNSEVTGVLNLDNILFVNAEKFLLGVFETARIPFLNHVGRMGEQFTPINNSLLSGDGVKYTVSPAVTDNIYDHYHSLYLDKNYNGITSNTFINGEAVNYEFVNSSIYLVGHTHGISGGFISNSSGNQLGDWLITQNLGNSNSISHTHNVLFPTPTDPKIIYSIVENENGSIYIGTSNGFYTIPYIYGYDFIINGIEVFILGTNDNLWNMLLQAKPVYESKSGLSLVLTQAIYQPQLDAAATVLLSDGDSYLMYGINKTDQIMIKKKSFFQVPNFVTGQETQLGQTTSGDNISSIKLLKPDGTDLTATDIQTATQNGTVPDYKVFCTAASDTLTNYPIWTMALGNANSIFICGQNTISKNKDLDNNFYQSWAAINLPYYSGILRTIYRDSYDNIWLATNAGVLILRYYQNKNTIESTYNTYSCYDIVEGQPSFIYSATEVGISLSSDFGTTWTKVLQKSNMFRIY